MEHSKTRPWGVHSQLGSIPKWKFCRGLNLLEFFEYTRRPFGDVKSPLRGLNLFDFFEHTKELAI